MVFSCAFFPVIIFGVLQHGLSIRDESEDDDDECFEVYYGETSKKPIGETSKKPKIDWSKADAAKEATSKASKSNYQTDKYKVQRNKWYEFTNSTSMPNKLELYTENFDKKLANFCYVQWQVCLR